MSLNEENLGIVVVDHGSRRAESNEMLLQAVREFVRESPFSIVEPAHMELAEPSIATAFDRCVERGATTVVVFPYFLLPGRHWDEDIPRLTAQAASKHPGVSYLVTAPFGMHPLMRQVIEDRIAHCLARSRGEMDACDYCDWRDRCQLRTAAD